MKNPMIVFLLFLLILGLPAGNAAEQGSTTNSSNAASSSLQGIASGVKKVAYEGPKDFVKETVKEVPKKPSIGNVVEGVNKGTEKLLDHTVKGAYKVATFGKGDLESYEIEEPRKGSDDTTKIKIKIPGT